MRTRIGNIRKWFVKEPEPNSTSTEALEQALQELRSLNSKQTEALDRIGQPDMLRSLVISMNQGRNG